MTIAPNTPPLAAPTAPEAAVADVTTLLPSREAVLDRLAERLAGPAPAPTTVVVLGLLRRDDGWPTAQSTLAAVTSLLAGSLRGDDWLGKSGPGEFVVLLNGPVAGAETAAARLVAAVPALGIPDVTAAAGIAPATADAAADELLRRALLSLSAARRVGAGTVLRYREPQ
ncbi:GGDEF domain-containing protein [Blastococcus tunisiensis]|uniref:GGDEF domain-containing protein, diguanylate cyclase (C-di-GMP synthetase) or its enzymatically inactive variants n=1 Tax=Blastococcus tunisiensis TaxID=1798228 RepID=A0A1I2I3R7_9ACTN|nr:GGDEF domain-containing protein [Blastococcus sp. DSM 46838]SFF37069.1 GGDEF domain-containing protein, diguanylate cyclase (c-di-GMP synthetase) or its enzymatically inactive variants [Blastococcus sp. DSM 46838]